MCGIVGYTGSMPACEILLRGLKKLEYRGYDSAGVALLVGEKIEIQKSEGRLEKVENLFLQQQRKDFQKATCGMGHTRWATHGKPTTQNAHPHQTGHVVFVHNGIIENYLEIKKEILSKNYHPRSETDSELFGFLVLEQMDRGESLLDAVRASFLRVQGQCSFLVMSEKEPGVIVGVRNGSPLVAAFSSEKGAILASDAQALLTFSEEVFFVENGDLIRMNSSGKLEFFDLKTKTSIERNGIKLNWSQEMLEKKGYEHHMLKEIYDQPTAWVDTLNGILDRSNLGVFSLSEQPMVGFLKNAQELVLLACGSSWHAALLGKYWIEDWAGIPVSVELASEFRYRNAVIRTGAVLIGISQSGETADTLAALRKIKQSSKTPVLGITNVRGSSLSREVDAIFYTFAGPEVGVAATKTFTAQMLVLFLIAIFFAHSQKKKNKEDFQKVFEDLIKLPHLLSSELEKGSDMQNSILHVVESINNIKGFFFIGRGLSYPIALEGALKLKEIVYDYTEGYAAGELKHGPIAMIDSSMAVIVLAPQDGWREKTLSNMEEVKARGAISIGVGDSDDLEFKSLCHYWIPLPGRARSLHSDLSPFLLTPVVQLLSYYRAVQKGTDIDKPRNLAKSVTVE